MEQVIITVYNLLDVRKIKNVLNGTGCVVETVNKKLSNISKDYDLYNIVIKCPTQNHKNFLEYLLDNKLILKYRKE